MRIEGQLERAEGLVASIEEAERDVAQAEDALEFALGRVAAAQAQVSSADEGEAEAARHAASMAEAAAHAAQETLERAQGKLDAAHAARAELAAEVTGYVNEQGRAAARLADAQTAAPYGADALQRTRDQVLEHAALGNRVLQILGAHEVTIEGGGAVGSIEAADGATGGVASLEHVTEGSLASGDNWHDYGYAAGGVSLNQLVDTFHNELRARLGLETSWDGYLFAPEEERRLIGTDEVEQAQNLLDAYENRLSGYPGGTYVVERLRGICEQELTPRSLDLPINSVQDRDRKNVPLQQREHCNVDPRTDVEVSYYLTKQLYGKDSPEGREVAWRYADLIESEKKSLESELAAVHAELDPVTQRYYAFCDEHDLFDLTEEERLQFDVLRQDRDRALDKERTLSRRKEALDARHADVTKGLDPKTRTHIVGLNGSDDFVRAYDPFITMPQGYEFDDVRGCCGIGSSGSMVNEQFGERHGWSHCIDAYLNAGLACYAPSRKYWSMNGGTSVDDRCRFLYRQGLSVGQADRMSLSEIADLRRRGCSVELALHAQDLRCPGLSSRQHSDANTMKANHAVAVVAVSIDSDGKPSGVWLNDTGGWLSSGKALCSNRIFVRADKFEQMMDENNTPGFSVEYAWRADRPARPRQ